MKDTQSIVPEIENDKVVIVGQNEKHFQEVKWHIKQHKGHTLFEINMETGDIVPAQYEQVDLQVNNFDKPINAHLQAMVAGKVITAQEVKKKLITKKGCIYISALNIQSAAKKFYKQSKAAGLLK